MSPTSSSASTAEVASVCSQLGLAASANQIESLSAYLALLARWNKTYNLTAVRDPAGMLTQHLADCLALIGPLQRQLPRGRVLDVGSGGGLPGVLIAIMLPSIDVTCVDAVAKKMAFVRQVGGELHLPNLHVAHSRVENLDLPSFDVITSRAFASLMDFTALTASSLAAGGTWLAMKGHRPDEEMAALPSEVDVFHVEPLSVPGLNAHRCLIWMRRGANSALAAASPATN